MTTVTQFSRVHYEAPSDDELRRLLEIVVTALPDLRQVVTPAEFGRAMFAVSTFGRTAAPDTAHYFAHWVEIANARLKDVGLGEIGGGALMAGVLAHGDVVWRAHDRFAGQLCELGLAEYPGSGRPCSNRWRDLLSGRSTVLAPVPSDRRALAGMQTVKASEGRV
jgi:hypothetical protein